MAKLNGDAAHGMAIGCEISELTAEEMLTAQLMILRGLIDVVDGWRGTRWLMLTGDARRLIEESFSE